MECSSQSNNVNDKLASLMKEAETLKSKLDEERQKLNDVTRKYRVEPHLKFVEFSQKIS